MSAHLAAKGKVPEGPAVISLSSLPWREGDSAEVPSKGTCASTAAGLTALPAWEAGQLCCSSLSPQALYSHWAAASASTALEEGTWKRSSFLLPTLSEALQPTLKKAMPLWH